MRYLLTYALSAVLTLPLCAGDRVPVIVELFTAEGCSSCPPADRLLAYLEKEQPVPEAEIIPLGEHVDYWNQEGWPDRFAAHRFTVRQQVYARTFDLENIYTPQMVVNGEAEFNGSDGQRAVRAIRRAAGRPHAAILLSHKGDSDLALSVDQFPDKIKDVEIFLAITEDGLASDVRTGENAGRHLIHSGVVRSLTSLTRLNARKSPGYTADVPLHLEDDWNRHNLRAIVVVEDRVSQRIVGAAQLSLQPSL